MSQGSVQWHLARVPAVVDEATERAAARLNHELVEAQRKARRHEAPTADAAPARDTPMPVAPSTTFALAMPRGDR
jgi:hypothetical protein